MTTVQEILDAARMLPSGDRAQLICALWDSVSTEDWTHPGKDCLTEVQSRSEACDAGQMTTAPWSEVRERARRKSL